MNILRFWLIPCLLISNLTQASVIYDESVSGDLQPFDPITLNLSAGQNSVIGSSGFTPSISDFDSFSVFLSSNLRLLSVDYFISNLSVIQGTSNLETGYELTSGGYFGSILANTQINLLGSSHQSMFGNALPVDGGSQFFIDNFSLSTGGSSFEVGGTWDYEIRFTTTTVPEPTTITLMGLGFAGMAFRRRKSA